ncbi:uncharacterized protein RCC_00006 [Ramularia collo-cygni]|uniref:MYND-type domain-containing protein n=1 Tax=Ramularia collo-cygni TaxID=112498 RepID=A0A2D3ULP2_9PEZI|nr:uncharacterized protein RCC_00006 [Ramularia collo-cygni]CZT14031.1 uncharacterized protein RCC_00006 [Ramularia collo-cygni]
MLTKADKEVLTRGGLIWSGPQTHQKVEGVPMAIPFLIPLRKEPNSDMKPDRLLHLTARIGIPLNFCVLEDPCLQETILQALITRLDLEATPENGVLHHLSATTTSTSPMTMHCESTKGIILLARVDGKPLHLGVANMIWLFVETFFGMIRDVEERSKQTGLPPKQTYYELFERYMKPEEFVKFWDTCAGSLEEARDVQCPVCVACKACGNASGPFMRCGRCEIAKYCNQACQKEDWREHKKVCTKA